MAGVKTLRKIQLGQEVTAGNEVNASTIWRGLGTINDETEIQFSDEDVGLIAPTLRSFIGQYVATLEMPDTEMTFEQLPYILDAGIVNDSPSADGGGTGYIYQYDFPTTAKQTIKTYTLEMGNNQQEEQMLYSFVREFGFSGASGEAVMMSATWQGRRVQPGTFTAALSIPAVENVVFQKGKLYVDAVSGSFGSTQVSSSLMSFSFSMTTGFHAKYTADGDLQFADIDQARPEIELELVFRHNASAVAEIANWRAETPRLIRLIFEGSALGTPGTSYTYRTVIIDVAGKFVSVGPLEDSDGNDVRTFTFRGGYDETAAEFGKIIVVNELSALP